jgi:hypothetical protein
MNLLIKLCISLPLIGTLVSAPVFSQTVADPPPYAAIANPLPDTMDHQKRDSVNLKFSRVRVNQAGYRPQDEKLFYYVGTSASSFSVINLSTGSTAATGSLTSLNATAAGQLKMTCYHKAQLVSGGAVKYTMQSPSVSGTVYKGLIPDLPEGRYMIKVGSDESAPFLIRADVYGMVKDALLKYFGIARCGNNDSWFHAACHLKDAVPGGWHDAGDHLKESQSIGYAMAVLGLCAAALQDRDADHYAKNQSLTFNTDGIPDVLVEAKVGADYVVNSWDLGGQTVGGIKTNIGDFGKDHGWWGRPEYQDAMGPDRGGPPRPAISGLGGNSAGSMSAGLAFVGRLFAPYDAAYSAKCITVAKALYAWGKSNQTAFNSPALNGGGATYDDLAIGALALWWATKDTSYRYDLLYNPALGTYGNAAQYPKGGFKAGWFVHDNPGPQKGTANTGWARLETYGLWGLYRLILMNDSTAAAYGLSSAERLNLVEDVIYCLIGNLSDVNANTGDQITLPASSFQWKGNTIKSTPLWGWMYVEIGSTWMPNRYQAGNITEMFCYYDMASKIQGTELPNSPATTDWKVNEVKSLLLKQLNYLLGMNPWDVSMVTGVGGKSLNHPHHRAATPELVNVPGAFYKYCPAVGALSAGYDPALTNLYDEYMGGSDGYFHTEVSIDATTALFLPVMGLAKEDTIKAPSATVRTVFVGCDSAIIEIRMTRFGSATVRYGTQMTSLTQSKSSVSLGVFHRITLTGLSKGTTYYFDVLVRDQFNREAVIMDLDPDKNKIPFKFTTLTDCPTDAQITNVKICRVTHDSAEIFWYTPNGEFDSKVVYDTVKPPARWTAYDITGRPVNFHYVKIGGLKEKTTYYFYVQSGATVDNNNGQFYTFTTTVEHVNFDVRAVQYTWAGKPAVGIVIVNQDVKSYDSLDLRLYFRSKDGFENDLGARFDIINRYAPSGFQEPIDPSLMTALRLNLQKQKAVKMQDTYNPTDGTYAYYFPLPLWGLMMESQSRIRLDVIFVRWEPTRLVDQLDEPPLHQINDADWSFGPHHVANGDPVEFPGIPTGSKDDVDNNYWSLPIDQYITVYRKGEYIWGFSPSYIEQQQKKNYYVLTTQITSPLSNPSQDYVFFERTIDTVNVTGWATITPVDGKINDIWVNGTRLVNPSSYVQWNDALKRYDFTIPVPVTEGRNVVDITIFAGPSDCKECFGCANSNHHFFIEFRGAKNYPSKLELFDLVSRPILSGDTAHIDTTVFNVFVTDTNGNLNVKVRDTILVSVRNPSGNDSLLLRLVETGDSTGIFQTIAPVSVVSTPPGQRGPNQIFMSGGDRLAITYVDPTDPADSSQAYLITVANFPVPQRGWYKDANGDGAVDSAVVVYDKALLTAPDSIRTFFPDSSALRMVRPASGTIRILGSSVGLTITPPFAAATTAFSQNVAGSGISWLTSGGLVRKKVFPMADSVGPILVSATVVERFDPGIDTLYVALSEAIQPQTLAGATFILIKNGVSTVITVSSSEALPNSYALVLAAGAAAPQFGDSLRINPAGPVADAPGNTAHPLNPAVPLGIKAIPASGISGYYIDRDGNGVVDTAVVTFNKKVPAGDLSLSFDWGNQIRTLNPIGGASIRYKNMDSAVIAVFIRGAFANAPLVKTSGDMYVTGRFSSSNALVRAPKLADSAAPVIDSALYTGNPLPQTGALRCDTLTVFYSEPAIIANPALPYSLSRSDGTRYTFGLQSISLAANRARFLVTAVQGTDYPKTGDSIWIDIRSQTADSGGALQAAIDNRRALLKVKSSLNWAITLSQNPVTPVLPTSVSVGVPGVAVPLHGFTASLRIYDGLGNVILPETPLAITNTGLAITWDGRNRNNRYVGNGTYLAVVKVVDGDNVETVKRMLIGVKKQ